MGALVLVSLTACQSGKDTSPASDPSVAEDVNSDGDTSLPFTPPEIRRMRSVADSGVGDSASVDSLAETVDSLPQETASVPPVEAAPVEKPVPVSAPLTPPTREVPAKVAPPPVLVAAKTGSPSDSEVGSAVQPGDRGDWVIQVGIHKSEDGAQAAVARLGAQGIPAYVVQAAPNAGLSGSYWRVRVGRFEQRSDAKVFGETVLKKAGIASFWIDRKANEARTSGGTP
ncbi:MAG: SPOR domain-containing protein [Fibrobacteria bacterium]|nr:SPOR domain-containing protein [Fibrobacteria bacterium]